MSGAVVPRIEMASYNNWIRPARLPAKTAASSASSATASGATFFAAATTTAGWQLAKDWSGVHAGGILDIKRVVIGIDIEI
jgi:hypothetical protein